MVEAARFTIDERVPTKCLIWQAVGPRCIRRAPAGADEIKILGSVFTRSNNTTYERREEEAARWSFWATRQMIVRSFKAAPSVRPMARL